MDQASLLIQLLFLAGGVALLYFGAEGLVRGSAALGLRMGVPPLVVGLTLVAMGTSSPELVVSLRAALGGDGGIAVGNVVGSNIANVALILGCSALLRPLSVQAQVVRLDLPAMILAAVLLTVFLRDGLVGASEGLVLLVAMIGYTALSITVAKREQSRVVQEEVLHELPVTRDRRVGWNLFLAGGGLAVLVAGANLLVRGAVALSLGFGVSEAVVGLTVVAVGTSLPELATSVVAAWRGDVDVAVGNVVGSNLFNSLAIPGVAALVAPLAAGGVGWVDLGVMVGLSCVLLPLARSGFVLSRAEGGVLLVLYAAYILHLARG